MVRIYDISASVFPAQNAPSSSSPTDSRRSSASPVSPSTTLLKLFMYYISKDFKL